MYSIFVEKGVSAPAALSKSTDGFAPGGRTAAREIAFNRRHRPLPTRELGDRIGHQNMVANRGTDNPPEPPGWSAVTRESFVHAKSCH